jgi:hypothetical protein
MADQIDYVGSTIIAGIVAIIVFSLNASTTQTAYTRNAEQISQDAATNMMEILEYDFYKMGYRVTAGEKIMVAESLRISFAADLNNSGTPATVTYTVGDSTQLKVTSHIHDRPLFRTVNSGASANIVQGLTDFSFAYFDTGGHKMSYSSLNTSANRAVIRGITVTLTVELGNPLDTTYVPVKMSKQIWPKNLGIW